MPSDFAAPGTPIRASDFNANVESVRQSAITSGGRILFDSSPMGGTTVSALAQSRLILPKDSLPPPFALRVVNVGSVRSPQHRRLVHLPDYACEVCGTRAEFLNPVFTGGQVWAKSGCWRYVTDKDGEITDRRLSAAPAVLHILIIDMGDEDGVLAAVTDSDEVPTSFPAGKESISCRIGAFSGGVRPRVLNQLATSKILVDYPHPDGQTITVRNGKLAVKFDEDSFKIGVPSRFRDPTVANARLMLRDDFISRQLENAGLSVTAGVGLQKSEDGEISVFPGEGITVDSSGVRVNIGEGLMIDGGAVAVNKENFADKATVDAHGETLESHEERIGVLEENVGTLHDAISVFSNVEELLRGDEENDVQPLVERVAANETAITEINETLDSLETGIVEGSGILIDDNGDGTQTVSADVAEAGGLGFNADGQLRVIPYSEDRDNGVLTAGDVCTAGVHGGDCEKLVAGAGHGHYLDTLLFKSDSIEKKPDGESEHSENAKLEVKCAADGGLEAKTGDSGGIGLKDVKGDAVWDRNFWKGMFRLTGNGDGTYNLIFNPPEIDKFGRFTGRFCNYSIEVLGAVVCEGSVDY